MALDFCSVHLPYDHTSSSERRCLYICPKLDFININIDEVHELSEPLVDFIFAIQAYDLQYPAILHLDIGTSDLGIAGLDARHIKRRASQQVHVRLLFRKFLNTA